jgi:general L-amino acid transport system substrate-binding protein
LINAEEMGITSKNVKNLVASAGSTDPSINRLLGTGDAKDFGAYIGLEKDWAANAIMAVGNYGEIFERNVGVDTALGLQRGTNALWTNGGILYAAPIR